MKYYSIPEPTTSASRPTVPRYVRPAFLAIFSVPLFCKDAGFLVVFLFFYGFRWGFFKVFR